MLDPTVGFSAWLVVCLALVHFGRAADFSTNLVPAADTGLYEVAPTNNLGRSMSVPAGVHNGGRRSRYLVRFDPRSALPAGSVITAAELKLYVTAASTPEHDYALHRLLRDWAEGKKEGNNGSPASEGETTWLARFHPATAWASPGGSNGVDYATVPSATAAIGDSGSINLVSSSALVTDVQFWLEHPEANYGWLIRAVDESAVQTARRFASRETVTNTPVLTIQYRTGPALHSTKVTNGWFSFCFEASSNQAYIVQAADELPASNWRVASNLLPASVTYEACFSQPLLGTNQFFRVLEE